MLAILAIALVLGMTSCGDGGGGGGGNDVSSVDTGEDYIEIGNCILKIPTADEEFLYLTTVLDAYRRGYTSFTIPRDSAVDAYLAALRAAEADGIIHVSEEIVPAYNAFKKAFKERIYKREDYVKGFNAFKAAFTTFAAQAVPVYAQYERIWGELPLPAPFQKTYGENQGTYGYEDYWGLHVPEKYIIQLSLYGKNGEYVHDYEGWGYFSAMDDMSKTADDLWKIVQDMEDNGIYSGDAYERAYDDCRRASDDYIRATNDPDFRARFTIKDTTYVTVTKTGLKGSVTPLALIIHETGHQALSNVSYFIPPGTNERLDDLFIIRLFGRLIPGYGVQTIPPEYPIDEIFRNADVLDRLPQYLMEFRQKYDFHMHPVDLDRHSF